MRHRSLRMNHMRLLFVCLCQACTAFVFVPTTTRFLPCRAQRPSLRSCAPLAVGAARPPPAAPCGRTIRSIRRRPLLLSSSAGNAGEGSVAVSGGAAGAAPEDPFRPEKASFSPMTINAVVSVLFKHVRRYTPRHPIFVRGFCSYIVYGGRCATSLSECSCAHTIRSCSCR